jgi:DNA helicase-2/ATP-dependent DNA helicase PcrA
VKQYPAKMIHIIISKWKDQGLTPDKIGESDFIAPAYRLAKIVYFEYQKQMHASNAVDFGDLLLYCNQLLIHNQDILEHLQNAYLLNWV